MGAGNQAPGMGRKTVDAGKQAMLEAMMRQRMEEQAGQGRVRAQAQSPETGLGVPAGYRPGLAPDYTNMESESRLRELANSSNVAAANPTEMPPVRGGISMGPGRSGRYTDEDAQQMMRDAMMRQRPEGPRF